MSSLSIVNTKALRSLSKVAERLRDHHEDMTLFQATFLFAVAMEDGITQRRVYELLHSNDSVASRTTALFTDIGNRHTPGLELMRADVNPLDRRERFLRLTPKGRRLLDDIVGDLTK